MTQSEKMEIITLVEQSSVSVKATLQELGINRSTFYQWRSAAAV
ncbi:helix-turn-helix domain-containing protein [Telluribacter sp. SYSU D00476]